MSSNQAATGVNPPARFPFGTNTTCAKAGINAFSGKQARGHGPAAAVPKDRPFQCPHVQNPPFKTGYP